MPDDVLIARALHVLGVVLWIGGVGFVTTVLLPSIRRNIESGNPVDLFEVIEGRFAWQARGTTLLVGVTGFYMVHTMDLWSRFSMPGYWWMHAMVFVWLVFSFMLFIAEPVFLHRFFMARAKSHPVETFRMIQRLHWVLLIISLGTVLGATIGGHGG
jgi:uncharacterized membrane protein